MNKGKVLSPYAEFEISRNANPGVVLSLTPPENYLADSVRNMSGSYCSPDGSGLPTYVRGHGSTKATKPGNWLHDPRGTFEVELRGYLGGGGVY